METVAFSCSDSQRSCVDILERQTLVECLVEAFRLHQIVVDSDDSSEDQGIGSGSEDDWNDEMALDLRKIKMADDAKELSDDDNTAVALDLTSPSPSKKHVGPPPPPLTPLIWAGSRPSVVTVSPVQSFKELSDDEKTALRCAYFRLARFLQLDAGRYPEQLRSTALRRFQALLFLYLVEAKKKGHGLNLFQSSFGSDDGLRKFLAVFLGKSEQLNRTPPPPPQANNVLRPARFAVIADDAPQILCRGPERSHNKASHTLRRSDSSHHPYAGNSASSASMMSSMRMLHHQRDAYNMHHQNSPSAYHPQQQQSGPNSMPSSVMEDQRINLEEVIARVCLLFPLSTEVEGLMQPDFEMLYGPVTAQLCRSQALNMTDDSMMKPKLAECRTTAVASPPANLASPGSPSWLTNCGWSPSPSCSLQSASPCPSSTATSPYPSVFLSPPSSNSSPAPASPLPRSMENQMKGMRLDLANQPPPLIPVHQPVVPVVQQQVVPVKARTAREELTASLNPATKEQSMRAVVKSSMEALTKPDSDGDTPLMIACANPAYKNEDLYALLERLKGHPTPAEVFTARNNKLETALFLAASERRPLVTGYVAEIMCELKIALNQTYEQGNTLIHYVAMWGDDFNGVLRYLVRIRMPDNRPAFDLNARNRSGRSALHEIVMLYHADDTVGDGFIKNIELLLDYGADAGLSEIKSGKTPVHMAVEKRDPFLLELLLSKCPRSANVAMYNDNRPLHSAATLTGIDDARQLELVNILLKYGADKALRNKANKLPIELVQQDRDRVKAVLQARSRQNNYGGY